MMMPGMLDASKGLQRAHISYSTQPNAQMSLLLSYGLPCTTCSGHWASNIPSDNQRDGQGSDSDGVQPTVDALQGVPRERGNAGFQPPLPPCRDRTRVPDHKLQRHRSSRSTDYCRALRHCCTCASWAHLCNTKVPKLDGALLWSRQHDVLRF